MRNRAITPCALTLGLFAAGCAPDLNWREVRPERAEGLVAWFPCKPDRADRVVAWPGLPKGTVHLLSCQTEGALWAMRYTTVPDVRLVAPTVDGWVQSLKGVPGAAIVTAPPVQVPGMTPLAQASTLQITLPASSNSESEGRRHLVAWHFSHGLTVFQATVWRRAPFESRQEDEDVILSFKNGLHFRD